MIPDSTAIERDGSVVEWRNDDFNISVDEAEAIADEVMAACDDDLVTGVLVDNREAGGTWPSEVNDVWSALMEELYEAGLYCATVSPSVTNSMQINRLSRESGTDDRIQAFQVSEYQEALDFVGGK